ncbi:MAG: ABC transporter substrate-binding protein [Anaerolineales bacterium]
MMSPKNLLLWLGLLLISLAACGRPVDLDLSATASAEGPGPTPVIPTPEIPPETMVVCLPQEPETLYLYNPGFYGSGARSAEAVLEAIYDGPVDLVDYAYQPVILDGLPELSSGVDAAIEEVAVLEGGIYLDPVTRLPENLAIGSEYLPVGCRSSACSETYQGGEVMMERMVVDFHLQPGWVWSDGEPLTAADSVFSYQINADPGTPSVKYLVDRTASYQALDDTSVRWFGIPGWFDAEYQSLFWTPLPEHVLGTYSAAELQTLELASQMPLGWGPYMIREWQPGEQIVLDRNPNYLLPSGEPPFFDVVVFRFIGPSFEDAYQQLLTGECDVIDESFLSGDALPTLVEAQQSGELDFSSVPGSSLTRLDFNLEPVGEARLFADMRTRQGLGMCMDRQAIAAALYGEYGLVTDSFVSPSNPAYYEIPDGLPYDAEAGAQLLQETGWRYVQDPPEGPRQSLGVPWLLGGTPLSFELIVPVGTIEQQVADRIEANLEACGAEVSIRAVEAGQLSSGWPDGLVFGRQFQAVVWTWPDWVVPFCQMYASSEIPSDEILFGSNAGGFQDSNYDAACEQILFGIPESPEYTNALEEVQRIYQEQRPGVPLFVQPRIIAYQPDICGLSLDSLTFTAYWNIEEWTRAANCSQTD